MAQPPFPQPQPEPNFPERPEGPGLPQPGGEPRLPEPDWGSPVPGEGRPGGDPEPHIPGRQPGGAGEPGIPGGSGPGSPGGPGGFGGGNPEGEGSGELPREGEVPREPQRPGEEGESGDGNRKDRDAPEQVRTAWFLYIMAAIAAVLASATALLPGGRSVSVEQVRDAVPGGMSEYSDEQLQAAATLSGILGVILVVVVSALFLLAARQLFKGKQWARALLTVGSIVLIAQGLAALLVLFAGGSPQGAPAEAEPVPNFIELAASVCAGLFAGTALWQLYTKESTAFFQERSGVGKP